MPLPFLDNSDYRYLSFGWGERARQMLFTWEGINRIGFENAVSFLTTHSCYAQRQFSLGH